MLFASCRITPLFLIAENDCCGDLPVLEQGNWLVNFSGCGGNAIATCNHGYTLPDCSEPEVLSCNCSGSWTTPSIDACIGKYL